MSTFKVGDKVRLKEGVDLCCGDRSGDVGYISETGGDEWGHEWLVTELPSGATDHWFDEDELELVEDSKWTPALGDRVTVIRMGVNEGLGTVEKDNDRILNFICAVKLDSRGEQKHPLTGDPFYAWCTPGEVFPAEKSEGSR